MYSLNVSTFFFIKHQSVDRTNKTKRKMNRGSIKSQQPLLNLNLNFCQLFETKIMDIWEQYIYIYLNKLPKIYSNHIIINNTLSI